MYRLQSLFWRTHARTLNSHCSPSTRETKLLQEPFWFCRRIFCASLSTKANIPEQKSVLKVPRVPPTKDTSTWQRQGEDQKRSHNVLHFTADSADLRLVLQTSLYGPITTPTTWNLLESLLPPGCESSHQVCDISADWALSRALLKCECTAKTSRTPDQPGAWTLLYVPTMRTVVSRLLLLLYPVAK